ncbi:Acyl-CoA synthetase member 2 mitochondrial [Mactra antiquata]
MLRETRSLFRLCKTVSVHSRGILHPVCLKRSLRCLSIREYATQWSYTHGPGEVTLRGITIGRLLQDQTEKTPDRDAVVFVSNGIRKTFSQLLEESDRLAAGLLELGIKKGDRVGIWGPNSIEWVLTQYATARAGIILVNINPLYRTFELEYALQLVS